MKSIINYCVRGQNWGVLQSSRRYVIQWDDKNDCSKLKKILILLFCLDVDECANPESNDCDPNALCTNTEGSYVCRCIKGFTGDGKRCTGIAKHSNSYRCRKNSTISPDSIWKEVKNSIWTTHVFAGDVCSYLMLFSPLFFTLFKEKLFCDLPCGANKVCKNFAGVPECVCKDGYIGEDNCTGTMLFSSYVPKFPRSST